MDELMKEAFSKALAAKVLEALDGDERDSILAQGVAKALDGYDMRSACSKLITDRAQKLADKIIKSGKYDEQIREALIKTFQDVIAKIPEAAEKTFKEAIFGRNADKNGYGSTDGLILRHF